MKGVPRLIGVIHLPALAGAPGAHGLDPADALQRAGAQAVKEAQALTKAGFEALILENFGDIPFYRERVPAETIASLSVIAAAVREVTKLPLGINVLRNDGFSALAIAAVNGLEFMRVNVLSGVAATDQGMIQGQAAELLRERTRLHAEVAIFADVHVKHARTISSDDVGLAVEETALRAGADAVIVSGTTTGRGVSREVLEAASRVARAIQVPLFVGSGATRETLKDLAPHVTGVIVSSTLRRGGKAGAPLDSGRTRAFVGEFRKVFGRQKR
ncbi:BtpA/SgcQ family protein [Bdellovibrionota bacterium FG-2]